MLFCPHCGNSIDTGQVFCHFYGASINKEASNTLRSPPSIPAYSRATPPLPPSTQPMQSPPPPNSGILLSPAKVLGIIGIILIMAAAAFFVLSGPPLSAGTPNITGISNGSGILPVNSRCSAGMSLCSGTCVYLQTDSDNCGACGFSVPYGETCRNGQFSSVSPENNSGLSPAPAGMTTADSAITSATTAAYQLTCPSGRTSCSGTCTNLSNDAENCGSCGNICQSGQNCQNTRCIQPVSSVPVVNTRALITITPESSCIHGEIVCGSSCVNIFSDKENCGDCGRACGSQEISVNARCGSACTESGTTLCNDNCVDLNTDMDNCGACGTECKTFLPNAKGSLCTGGQCIIFQCKTDYGDCNKKISDGCEVYLRIDAGNCGSCGKKCSSGQVCYNGQCSDPIVT